MSESLPKISVIVPVYKAEIYLHRCVDSLLAQTFQDFEILLVDDGSPDRSGEICDEYARKDKRVRVFHKGNGGVSSARQCGMDNAIGEYTIHVDSDDWVESTMLEELYKEAKEKNADMVICDFYYEFENGTKYAKQQPSLLEHKTVLRELFLRLHGSCWNKLIKRDCYRIFEIQFPLGLSFCEDLFVNMCLLSHEIKIEYLARAFYHYDLTINTNSLVRKPGCVVLSQEKLFLSLVKAKLPHKILEEVYLNLLFHWALILLRGDRNGIKTFRTDFQELKPLIKKADVPAKWKIIVGLAFYISPYCAHLLYRVWMNWKHLFIWLVFNKIGST